VLPRLGALRAATLQLSVPVITALGALALLGETLGLRQSVAAAGILGGIALVLRGSQPRS
jgi:drug/metabolite transporter (DMT)-like permease